jgi:hypothetical protein
MHIISINLPWKYIIMTSVQKHSASLVLTMTWQTGLINSRIHACNEYTMYDNRKQNVNLYWVKRQFWETLHVLWIFHWGHGQTSNFSCAEPNADEVKQRTYIVLAH